MADEPINIQVVDNVDPNIVIKLNSIADASDKGTSALARIKAALSDLNSSALSQLQADSARVTDTINRELDATRALNIESDKSISSKARLTAAIQSMGAASAKALLGEQRLQTELLRTQAAESKLEEQKNRTALSAIRLQEAQDKQAAASLAAAKRIDEETAALVRNTAAQEASATATAARVVPTITGGGLVPLSAAGAARAAKPIAEQEAATDIARGIAAVQAAGQGAGAGIRDVEAATEKLGATGVSAFARFKSAGAGAFDTIRDFVTGNGTRFKSVATEVGEGVEGLATKAASATPHIRGNSTAIRELLVIAREGGRGDFTRMAGSVSILASSLGLLNAALPFAIAGIVGLVAAKTTLNTDKEKKSLEDYAGSLGLTEKEMRKLKDTTVDASGKLKEHNDLQITFGDVISGVWREAKSIIAGVGDQLGVTKGQVKDFTSSAIAFLAQFFAYFVGTIGATAKALYTEVQNLYIGAYNAGVLVGNQIYSFFADVANGVITLFNGAATIVNGVTNALGQGDVVGKFKLLDNSVAGMASGLKSFKSEDFFGDVQRGADATNRALSQTGQFIKDAARERIKAEADAIKANRNPAKPKKDTDPKDKDDYLDDTNMKLDAQLKNFGMLKDARETQQKLDEIALEFQKRRMPLNDAELAQFREKLTAIQANNRVQAEMDKIYDDLNGPMQTFQTAQSAILQLFVRGNITLDQYNQELAKATRSYKEATDPLFAINEELDKSAKLYGKNAEEVEKLNNQEKIRQAFLSKKGIDPFAGQGSAADQSSANKALSDLNRDNNRKFVDDQVKSVTNQITADSRMLKNKKAMYDEINDMRKNDQLTEAQATQAKFALNAKFDKMKLQSTSDTLDQIAQLSSSKNKVLAGIGKAAAVASATIKGYEAVQTALASAPPPISYVLAATTGLVAAQNVAKIINTPTDAGSYQTGGSFIARGQTGVDQNRIAMNVSDGERVTIETVSQQRDRDRASNDNAAGDTHVNNFFDEASFLSAIDTQAGHRVVMNVIAKNANKVGSTLGVKK